MEDTFEEYLRNKPEPIIEELEAPYGDPIHQFMNIKYTAVPIIYACECGFFGEIMSNVSNCLRCNRKISFNGKRMVLE